MTTQVKSAGDYADAIMAEIHDDMRAPFHWGKQIPRNVGSFSALHDYCDANMYLIDAVPDLGPACDCDMSARVPSFYEPGEFVEDHTDACAVRSDAYERAQDAWNDLLNAVSNEVDRRLAAEATVISGRVANLDWNAASPGDYGVIDGYLLDTLRDANPAAWHYHHEGPLCADQAAPSEPCDCGTLPHPRGVVGCVDECRHTSCQVIVSADCLVCIAEAESAEFDRAVLRGEQS